MHKRFALEAVMIAIYGQLLMPDRPVEYYIPYSTIMELYDFKTDDQPLMPDAREDEHVRKKIEEMIRFFEEPLNRKKIERALAAPWRKASLIVNDLVTFQVVYSIDNAEYGEHLDPIETELVLTGLMEKIPILTDQLDFIDKVIEAEIPVQVFDIEDYEYALELTDAEMIDDL
jgi:hypothetical protein